jgi:hypothetical protein
MEQSGKHPRGGCLELLELSCSTLQQFCHIIVMLILTAFYGPLEEIGYALMFFYGYGLSSIRIPFRKHRQPCPRAKTIFKASLIFVITSLSSSPRTLTNRTRRSIGRVCKQSATDFLVNPLCEDGSTSTFVRIAAFLTL